MTTSRDLSAALVLPGETSAFEPTAPWKALVQRALPWATRAWAFGDALLRQLEPVSAPVVTPALPRLPAATGGGAAPQVRRQREPKTILAIGAHPDDVEIGCGGALASHVACGDRVVLLTLSGGERAGSVKQRAAESRAAAQRLGAELVMESLPDTRIEDGPDTISAIERVISNVSPDVVYVHSESDRHQDHRAVHRATMTAARHVSTVYCYQSPSSTTGFEPTRFVRIDEHLETKLELIDLYASQSKTKDYLAPRLIEATAVYWGRYAGSGSVEPFEVVREHAVIQ